MSTAWKLSGTLCVVISVAGWWQVSTRRVTAQEAAAPQGTKSEKPKKKVFLPKSPAAAAFYLRRMPASELVDIERSDLVYKALLSRPGIDRKYKVEALQGLVALNKSDELSELVAGIVRADHGPDQEEPVLLELLPFLLTHKPAALAKHRAALEELAGDGQRSLGRQLGYVGLIVAEGKIDTAWEKAHATGLPANLIDLLDAIPLVGDAKLRASFYDKVQPLLTEATDEGVRKAAIMAITSIPGHETDVFTQLGKFFQTDVERATSVKALHRIPRQHWPRNLALPLIESIIAYANGVPQEQRTEDDFLATVQLGNDLTTLLPAEQGKQLRRTLSDLGVRVVMLRAVPHMMIYDKPRIYLQAGKPAQISIENFDIMPHNFVIIAPGTREQIGALSDKLQTDPTALERHYVPDSPHVLFASKLLGPRESGKITLTAPAKPGDYGYVCTYPGHWQRMFGTVRVVPDLEAVPPEELNPPEIQFEVRPFVQEWTVADLEGELVSLEGGRSFANGKKMFTSGGCATCHKMQDLGGTIGPELSALLKMRNYKPVDLLTEIVEPSKTIDPKFRMQVIETNDGKVHTGLVLKQTEKSLFLMPPPSANPNEKCEPLEIKKADIADQVESKVSAMPVGLLNTLTKEDILDLLAYLRAGGDPKHPAFEE